MNFVRILKRLLFSSFSVNPEMGGEKQKSSLTHEQGYSEKAQCIGKPSYLESNSGSLQKPIEGRVAIGEKRNQYHVKKQYEPIWSVLEIECTNL